jgi:DME family drug/metabolite transporter
LKPAPNRLLIVITAILFSTGGVAIKAAALNGWQIACYRSAVATAVLVLLLPEARRGWNWRILPVSVAYAATLITFVLANRLTTAANAVFLQATAPLYVLLLSPWVLGERIRRSDTTYIIAVIGGLALFFIGRDSAVATAPDPPRGNLLSLASGVVYALMLIGMRWVGRDTRQQSVLPAVVLGNLLTCVVTLPMALTTPMRAAGLGAANLAVILYLGIFQVGIAYALLARAIPHVRAFEITAILLLEPALNPIWVWLVHGEKPGVWALCGGGLVLLATLQNAWRQNSSKEVAAGNDNYR